MYSKSYLQIDIKKCGNDVALFKRLESTSCTPVAVQIAFDILDFKEKPRKSKVI